MFSVSLSKSKGVHFKCSRMITSKAIPICRSPFQGESRMSSSSSPKSVGLGSYSSRPRRKSGSAMVAMAYAGANSVRDPHTTLGIAPGASKHEIKKAYRRLTLQYHPDVCEGNHCTPIFQQINFAYEVKQPPHHTFHVQLSAQFVTYPSSSWFVCTGDSLSALCLCRRF